MCDLKSVFLRKVRLGGVQQNMFVPSKNPDEF